MANWIQPQDVHSPAANWVLLQVVIDNGEGGWAMAVGRWDDEPCFGLRWSGQTDNRPAGVPSSRGYATWWIAPDPLTPLLLTLVPPAQLGVVRALLGLDTPDTPVSHDAQ